MRDLRVLVPRRAVRDRARVVEVADPRAGAGHEVEPVRDRVVLGEQRRVRVPRAQALVRAADVGERVVIARADARLVRVAHRDVLVRRRSALPDGEDVAAELRRAPRVVDQAELDVPVQERAVAAGAGELERGADGAVAVRVADVRGRAAEAADAAARVARLPRDRAVVEDDVEVARRRVLALDEQELEAVQLVGVDVVVADVDPVDAEGAVALVGRLAPAVADELRARRARVDVREERRDDDRARPRETERRVGRERPVERDVAVVVHPQLLVATPEEVDRERQRHRARRAVVVAFELVLRAVGG